MHFIVSQSNEIIPYQELSGSYNLSSGGLSMMAIIPYQELSGSYNSGGIGRHIRLNYTIPRIVIKLHLHNKIRPILYTYQLFD